jgi:membrane associated rhomboid family serine protease
VTLRDRQVFDPTDASGPTPRFNVRTRQPIPWAAGTVLVIAVAVWLYDITIGQHALGEWGALYGPLVARGQWWRILTDVFVHAELDLRPVAHPSPLSSSSGMGLMHIGFNMWVLVTLGFTFERMIGSARMALVSLATALGASAFSLAFNFNILTIGASGMIIGWIGALLPIVTEQGRRQLGIWLVEIAVISLLPGVSWSGHLGGFLFGLPCGLALRKGTKFWSAAGVIVVAGLLVNWLVVQAHVPRLG